MKLPRPLAQIQRHASAPSKSLLPHASGAAPSNSTVSPFWAPSPASPKLAAGSLSRSARAGLAASVLAMGALSVQTSAFAQAKAEPAYTLTGNAAIVSDYRYRGITQTTFDPALQVGADFSLPNGLYLGAFLTNIKWIKDYGRSDGNPSVKGSSELDLYGGFKTELAKGITGDIGILRYQYPGNTLQNHSGYDNANTTEIYGAVSFGPATLKYSRSTTNLFGNPNSKGSGYLDLTAAFDLGDGWSVTPHIGRQTVANATASAGDYTDVSVGLTKDFAGVLFGLTFVTVDAKDENFYQTFAKKFQGKSGVVLSARYNF